MSLFPNTAKKVIHKSLKRSQFNNLYNSIGRPTPFDVTLRDGLQGLTIEEQNRLLTVYDEYSVDFCFFKFAENVECSLFTNL